MTNPSEKVCEDCGRVGKQKNVFYFKGKLRCYPCRRKAGHRITTLPLTPPALALRMANKPDYGLHKKRKGSILLYQQNTALEALPKPEKVFYTGLSSLEQKKLWADFIREGKSPEEAAKNLKDLKKHVRESHAILERQLKVDGKNFGKQFEKLKYGGMR